MPEIAEFLGLAGTLLGGAVMFLGYMYMPEIKNALNLIGDVLYAYLPLPMVQVNIATSGHSAYKLTYALKQEIMSVYQDRLKKCNAKDAGNQPCYTLPEGIYTLFFEGKRLEIRVTTDEIQIMSASDMNGIQKALDFFYAKYTKPEDVLFYHSHSEGKWLPPYLRLPETSVFINQSMKAMIHDFDLWTTLPAEKKSSARGYLIHGDKGTGKSMIVKHLAAKYRRACYDITLNSAGMTDSSLINLVAAVPPHSIIVLDEFDKAWKTICENKRIQVSEGRILQVIAGTIPLNRGVVMIIIVNDKSVFDTEKWEPLVREGRIDKVFHFMRDAPVGESV